jgi:hypothetical protein
MKILNFETSNKYYNDILQYFTLKIELADKHVVYRGISQMKYIAPTNESFIGPGNTFYQLELARKNNCDIHVETIEDPMFHLETIFTYTRDNAVHQVIINHHRIDEIEK